MGWEVCPLCTQTTESDTHLCVIERVRLFSTKTLKTLGTLEYHKKSIQALIFARDISAIVNEDDSEDEMTTEEKVERSRWLIVGSQDNRASVWPLISFEKTG